MKAKKKRKWLGKMTSDWYESKTKRNPDETYTKTSKTRIGNRTEIDHKILKKTPQGLEKIHHDRKIGKPGSCPEEVILNLCPSCKKPNVIRMPEKGGFCDNCRKFFETPLNENLKPYR